MLNYTPIRSGRKKPPIGIIDRKMYAINDINDSAAQVRTTIVAPLFGQDALYAEKSEEAIDYVTSNYSNDLSNYPLIAAEVNATGKEAKNVAESILNKKTEWISFNAKIEEIRLRAKTLINNKKITTISEINEIVETAIQELNAI